MFGGFSLPLPALLLTYLPSIICGVHAIRTGRNTFWLWLFIIGPGIGPLIYVIAELVPEWFGGRTANRVRANLNKALAPDREYRAAKAALEETSSAGNRLRLGQAAMALEKYEEAEEQFAEAAKGQFADDPAMLMGHALALLELKRFGESLKRLEQLRAQGAVGQTPAAQLAYARALEGLGRHDEADAPYRFAADRSPGLEAAARYVAFMARAGRKDDARIGMTELERRYAKIPSHFRAEARRWRDYAANAVG
jgi:hypothetical protein